jgi:O-acetyl-ADP-ribose deacetylase (regulator of RNase III)
MITEAHGNLLQANAEALVNTVNTVGVMGKGIALQFKRAFPEMFRAYAKAVKAGDVQLGLMHVWPTGQLDGPRYIINFPTKGHWRAASRLADIDSGLVDLIRVVRDLKVRSVAVPPLGCGNGGLRWEDVEPRIRHAFDALPDVAVAVYPPESAPAASEMRHATKTPSLTPARAALIHMLSTYTDRTLQASLIETQKLLYFLQVAGEPLRLQFVRGTYGPYADNLRHTLVQLEGHYLVGFGDGSAKVTKAEPLRVMPGADASAVALLENHPDTQARIDRVLALTTGFESAYGLELLATVHWLATEDSHAAGDPSHAYELVRSWNLRKSTMFTSEHVEVAWKVLHTSGWFDAELLRTMQV